MSGWQNDMIEQADFSWARLRTRLDGLTDDEYFWEPTPLCWSVRQDEAGGWRADHGIALTAPPFTTIAWRIGHILDVLTDSRYPTAFGVPVPPAVDGLPGTAAEALARLESAYGDTRRWLTELDEACLTDKIGPIAGAWADSDKGSFALHMLDELIHHGAEVAVLRDLYRAGHEDPLVVSLLLGDRPAVDAARAADPDAVTRLIRLRADLAVHAAATGRWAALPFLIELGFPLADSDGGSALHAAAGAGNLAAVRDLIAAGADPTLVDPTFKATPLGWAEYFDQSAAADYLRPFTTADRTDPGP